MEAVDRLAKSTQVKIAGPALVGALSHSDRGVRDAAFQALKDMKQFDLLHGAMKGDMLSAEMREQIAAVLVESGSPAAQEDALQYLITKAKAPGKILACQTYGKRGAKTATPTLIEALKDDSAEVRAAAAEALAALKDERAITPLADAADAKARDKEVMLKTASEILASLSLDKVKGLVSSKNVTVRQMAIRALAEFAKGSRPRP
ncbi:MAG: HEAT repeat domain-containing protein, partial [Deltaproteobacteria bacterium]|nr:HEAT repeat domain-containing protein [Deltaproteobacteria bacterium]